MTYFDVKSSIEMLGYLGYNSFYDENQTSAFNGKISYGFR